MSSDSVYGLIGDLVGAIGQKSSPQPTDRTLKKCKSIAFGILLGKRSASSSREGCVTGSHQSELEKQLIAEEPIEMLHCHLFGMRLRARYQFQKRRCERMEDVLDRLELHRLGEREGLLEESDKAILQFLLQLRDSVSDGDSVEGVSTATYFGNFCITPLHFRTHSSQEI